MSVVSYSSCLLLSTPTLLHKHVYHKTPCFFIKIVNKNSHRRFNIKYLLTQTTDRSLSTTLLTSYPYYLNGIITTKLKIQYSIFYPSDIWLSLILENSVILLKIRQNLLFYFFSGNMQLREVSTLDEDPLYDSVASDDDYAVVPDDEVQLLLTFISFVFCFSN